MIEFSNDFHPLLRRQIDKYSVDPEILSKLKGPLLRAINDTYLAHDEDRMLLERSLELSSSELMQKNSQIQAIFQAFPDIFLHVGLDGKILDYKPAAMNISKILPQQLIGTNVKDIEALELGKILTGLIGRIKGSKELITLEHRARHENHDVYFEIRIKSLLKNQAIVLIRDITERKIAEEQLKFDALHDRLTKLPNRALLLDRLEMSIERNRRNPRYNFAVLFVDFDRFKLVNDSLGHPIGDALLISISERLATGLRGVDTLARLGGDEFCIILDEVKSPQDALMVADRLQKIASQPFFISHKELFLTLSVGVVNSVPRDKRTAEDFIRESDIAMYNAKKNGRAKYAIFTDEMHETAVKVLNLEADLHRAIENSEFILYYQPIMSLPQQQIIRMEALVRWVHPQRGLIPPLEFISLAEETGQIFKIGEFVLFNACRQCRQWHDQGFKDIEVAVNFSVLQFHHQNLPELIHTATQQAKLEPKYLVVEITESIAMTNIEHTVEVLRKLKEMNVRIAIDDFGTEYASLGTLIEFPIDSIKIDRKFVDKLPFNNQNIHLTSAIIELAHNLGLKVVSEGIETNDQLHFLSGKQCDEGQGFLFSKPLPAEEIQELLKRFNPKKKKK